MTMRDATNITNIGFSENDQRILHSILKIVTNLHPNMKQLGANLIAEADLVFVNGDDKGILGKVKSFSESITPIVLVRGNVTIENTITIRRPIVLKRVLQSIEKACGMGVAVDNNTQGKSNILVVDDSFPVRKYMEQKLHELSGGGVNLFFSSSGTEAVEKIKTEQFRAIFLDVVMPDINGYKICKWVKSEQPECRVVLLTGKKSPIDKVRGSMSGCDAYLVKPPDERRLSELFREIMSEQPQRAVSA